MPGAKVASTGRTDGPLLQKPLPQSLRYSSDNRVTRQSRKTKLLFWYSIAEANSADSPNLGGPRISAALYVETKVSTRAVSDDACRETTIPKTTSCTLGYATRIKTHRERAWPVNFELADEIDVIGQPDKICQIGETPIHPKENSHVQY